MFNVLDCFAGIGGSSLGLERLKEFKTVGFCEWDKDCQKVLRKNWPEVPIFNDIQNLKKSDVKHLKPNVLVGGSPCQDISFAGHREGIIKGKKSSLWREYARVIAEIKPDYAIIENVEYIRKNGLGVVLHDLSRIGYDAEWASISARSVGLPHQRRRMFIISYPRSKRCYEYFGKERHIQINEEWTGEKIYTEREQCQSKSIQICPILSRGAFDRFRASCSNRFASVSSVRRVTDGFPTESYEHRRKARIKQLGNALVPDIMEIVGKAILRRELIIRLNQLN